MYKIYFVDQNLFSKRTTTSQLNVNTSTKPSVATTIPYIHRKINYTHITPMLFVSRKNGGAYG